MARWIFILVGILILAVTSSDPVRCGAALPFQTIAPILVTGSPSGVQPISLAGSDATGIVWIGPGLLGGTEAVRDPAGATAIHLLARNLDGSWRMVQSSGVPGGVWPSVVLDLDGDGLQDLITTSLSRWSADILSYFRQNADGILLPRQELALPESMSVRYVSRAGTAGRLIVLGRNERSRSIEAAGVGWDTAHGLRLLWHRSYRLENSNFFRPMTWLPYGEFGVALIAEDPDDMESPTLYHTLRLDDGVWQNADLPRWEVFDGVFACERVDAIQRWMWGRSDSIYRLGVDPEGTLVPIAIPIRDLPTGWHGGYLGVPSRAVAIGDPPVIAKAGSRGSGEIPEIGFVELTPDGGARWIDCWQRAPDLAHGAPLIGMLEGANGSFSTLHEVAGAICESRGPIPAPAVDVPYHFELQRIYEDLTGDGIRDIFGLIRTPSGSEPYFSRGIAEPPWFMPPVPVSTDTRIVAKSTGDMDGDGVTDLVCAASRDTTAELAVLSFDGETLRRWDPGTERIAYGSPIVGDFDGNGRSEILADAGWGLLEHRLLSWRSDRTFASSTPIAGLLFNPLGTGDLDGDGRDEILGWHYADFELLRPNPDTGQIETPWRIASGLSTLCDGFVCNFDGDPSVEFVWSDFDATQVWSCDGPGERPYAQTIEGLQTVGAYGYLGAADFNADGMSEIVSSGEGVLATVWDPLTPGMTREEVRVLPDIMAGLRQVEPAIADVDGDGDPDLVLFREDGIRVERNATLEAAGVRPAPLQLYITGPNPSRGQVRAAFRAVAGGASARVELIDVAGRRVWEADRVYSPGTWIPLDLPEVGMREPTSGVYWLQVSAGGRFSRVKLTVVR